MPCCSRRAREASEPRELRDDMRGRPLHAGAVTAVQRWCGSRTTLQLAMAERKVMIREFVVWSRRWTAELGWPPVGQLHESGWSFCV